MPSKLVEHRIKWIRQQSKTAVKQIQDILELHRDNIVIIDTETTGLNYKTDEVIQVGVIDYSGKVLISEYLMPTCRIHPKAQQKHGLSKEILAEKGTIPFEEVHQKLSETLLGKVVVGYNLNFDSYFLTRMSDERGLPLFRPDRWQDMMELFSQIIGVWDSSRSTFLWQKLSRFIESGDTEGAHEAVFDCNIVLKQLQKIDNFR